MVKKKEQLYNKFKTLFLHPRKFYSEIEGEKKYSEMMFFYVKVSLVVIILNLILTLATIFMRSSGNNILTGIATTLLNSIFSFGIAFISPFAFATLAHLGVLIFGGKQKFFNTYKPLTYALSISALYNIIYLIVLWPASIINSTYTDFSTFSPETIWQNTGFMSIIIIYSVITLISVINMIYTGTIGLSKFQKISKLRAFFSMIIIPLILTIVGLIILVYAYSKIAGLI
jgi:hypothetical protein